jgi:hypothetical protein
VDPLPNALGAPNADDRVVIRSLKDEPERHNAITSARIHGRREIVTQNRTDNFVADFVGVIRGGKRLTCRRGVFAGSTVSAAFNNSPNCCLIQIHNRLLILKAGFHRARTKPPPARPAQVEAWVAAGRRKIAARSDRTALVLKSNEELLVGPHPR